MHCYFGCSVICFCCSRPFGPIESVGQSGTSIPPLPPDVPRLWPSSSVLSGIGSDVARKFCLERVRMNGNRRNFEDVFRTHVAECPEVLWGSGCRCGVAAGHGLALNNALTRPAITALFKKAGGRNSEGRRRKASSATLPRARGGAQGGQ